MRAICLLAAAVACGAHAQAYPTKPIRVVVPFVAGAGGDLSARLVSGAMVESLGQPMVVENRAGAGEAIGAEIVARSAPDGYTLLFSSSNALVFRPALAKSVPYDPIRDFTPVTAVGATTAAIIVSPSLPVSSIAELIDYAKAHPGKISYGTSGIGTSHHLAAEQIALLTGIQMVHIPYKSGIQPLNDLMAGLIPVSYVIMSTLRPQLKSGKVRVIAVTTGRRNRNIPDVPTLAESLAGFTPPPSWFGLIAPAALPRPVLARLHAEAAKAIGRPDIHAKLEAAGFEVLGNTPEEFAADIRRGIELVSRLVKAAAIQPTE
jgi:tripartite-type tricarboxylate transporter receptor subunit TctC